LNGVPEDDELVEELVAELDFAIQAENEGGKATWMACFSTRNNLWKRTINGMMLQFIQQLNGQNFYCTFLSYSQLCSISWLAPFNADYYGDTFFQSAGTQ
jgi:SP family sugar:H+ symporter-like MFS transporter